MILCLGPCIKRASDLTSATQKLKLDASVGISPYESLSFCTIHGAAPSLRCSTKVRHLFIKASLLTSSRRRPGCGSRTREAFGRTIGGGVGDVCGTVDGDGRARVAGAGVADGAAF